MIPDPPQLDLILKLLVPQALPGHCIAHRIHDHGLDLPLMSLVPTALPRRLLRRNRLQRNDALGEATGKLARVGAKDRRRNVDGRHQAVRRGGHGRELSVVGADALHAVHAQVDALPWAQLRDQDVWVHGRDGRRGWKVGVLLADGVEGHVVCVDCGVEALGLCCRWDCRAVMCAAYRCGCYRACSGRFRPQSLFRALSLSKCRLRLALGRWCCSRMACWIWGHRL